MCLSGSSPSQSSTSRCTDQTISTSEKGTGLKRSKLKQQGLEKSMSPQRLDTSNPKRLTLCVMFSPLNYFFWIRLESFFPTCSLPGMELPSTTKRTTLWQDKGGGRDSEMCPGTVNRDEGGIYFHTPRSKLSWRWRCCPAPISHKTRLILSYTILVCPAEKRSVKTVTVERGGVRGAVQ